jgi:hypothetical protein
MRRLVERLNEPFRRGVFGRDMRLGHIVVTAGERGPAATSRDRSASALPSLLIAGVAANSGAVPSTSGAGGLSLRRLGPSAGGSSEQDAADARAVMGGALLRLRSGA